MSKNILIVNEHDEPIGESTQQEALDNGLHHRIARIILRDENGRILCQQRSANKKFQPNLWDGAASGHVDAGETYLVAANRELEEELSVETKLHHLGTFLTHHVNFGKVTPVFHGIFEGAVPSSQPLVLQQTEVSATAWYSLDELRVLIANDPARFTQGFVELLERYYFKV